MSLSPIRLTAEFLEKLHLSVAGAHVFHLYEIAAPYGHWLEMTAIFPLTTFVFWKVLPNFCKGVRKILSLLDWSFEKLQKFPTVVSSTLRDTRIRIANYLLRDDLEE